MRNRAGQKKSPSMIATSLVVLALVALSACGGGGGSSSATKNERGTNTSKKTKESEKTKDLGCRFIVASTRPRETTPPPVTEFLTTAVAESAPCYDKITFTFDGGGGDDVPPGYLVEYRKKPYLEGAASSTAGFSEAKYVLYVEMRPVSVEDRRFAGRPRSTYKGNLRLGLKGMKHTVIVEWLSKASPELFDRGFGNDKSTTTLVPDPAFVPAPNDPDYSRVVWLIGVDEKRPFTVDAANNPPRISVLVMR
ncbi:MAG: hypothetical protein F2861_03320 [Actinobacteria bacterium]|jgi:hypothetical protein|nr:hypothetical protein [Actinomycetota bacterium]MSV94409.1 hypothetical protein [Actinomycetota bacterium]MSW61305.1 hypothetical protein [Actinomycetota bacterium]MSY44015.1 hypothetical protein [Actinomycetota bacterium]